MKSYSLATLHGFYIKYFWYKLVMISGASGKMGYKKGVLGTNGLFRKKWRKGTKIINMMAATDLIPTNIENRI